jgi:hypothetical protein
MQRGSERHSRPEVACRLPNGRGQRAHWVFVLCVLGRIGSVATSLSLVETGVEDRGGWA